MTSDLLEVGARRTLPGWVLPMLLALAVAGAFVVLIGQRPPTVTGHGSRIVPVQYHPMKGRLLI